MLLMGWGYSDLQSFHQGLSPLPQVPYTADLVATTHQQSSQDHTEHGQKYRELQVLSYSLMLLPKSCISKEEIYLLKLQQQKRDNIL